MSIQIFYINLEHRTDRKEQIEAELSKMDLSATRWPGTLNKANGAVGCFQSHLNVLKHCMTLPGNVFLILEDDFMFVETKDVVKDQFAKIQLFDFDVVNIGYNMKGPPKPYNQFLDRANGYLQTTSGYFIKKHFIPILVKYLEPQLQKLIATNHGTYCIDNAWKGLQRGHRWFFTKKRLGIQRESYSDIEKRNVAYNV